MRSRSCLWDCSVVAVGCLCVGQIVVGQIVVGGVSLSVVVARSVFALCSVSWRLMVDRCLVDADASCSLYIVLLCRLSLRLFPFAYG